MDLKEIGYMGVDWIHQILGNDLQYDGDIQIEIQGKLVK